MITYIDKNHTYIDKTVKIEDGVTIYPNVVIEGNTIIRKNTIIHMGCYIRESIIGENTIIYQSQIEKSQIGNHCQIGPFSHIRENNIIKDGVKIGSFVELNNNAIGARSKIPHLSYLADATIGENVNISCGVITANFNGKRKSQTIIEDNVFIGCNTNLIAPILIKKNSIIGAGVTLNENVEEDTTISFKEKRTKKNNKETM